MTLFILVLVIIVFALVMFTVGTIYESARRN